MFRKNRKRSWYGGTFKSLFMLIVLYRIARSFLRHAEKQGIIPEAKSTGK